MEHVKKFDLCGIDIRNGVVTVKKLNNWSNWWDHILKDARVIVHDENSFTIEGNAVIGDYWDGHWTTDRNSLIKYDPDDIEEKTTIFKTIKWRVLYPARLVKTEPYNLFSTGVIIISK